VDIVKCQREEGDSVARYDYGHVVTGLEEGEEAGVKVYFETTVVR
jgi:hypothetical protein